MKCSICSRTEDLSSETNNQVHMGKQKQIQNLQQQINLQRIKYNQALQRNFGRTSTQNIEQNQNIVQLNQVSKLTQKLAVKQNAIVQIKMLKQKIQQKKSLLEQHKKQRNQKLIILQNAQTHLNTIKTQALFKSHDQLVKIQQVIKLKTEKTKHFYKKLKKHFRQTFCKDLASILYIHRLFRLRESEKVFQIMKNDELDFRNSQKMAQSFYDIQNIQEVITKTNSSEKSIHVLFQNIKIFHIVQKVFKFYLPYQIQSHINFGQSKFIGKHENIRICGRKLINYSKTQKISNKMVQFFDQSIQEPIKSEETVKVEEQTFQDIKPQFDETIQFNKRIYALSKDFINFMQINLEFMSIKFGIPRRPLIFFQSELMSVIQKEFLWRVSSAQSLNAKPCRSQYFEAGYGSMLKQLKVSTLIDSIQNMRSMMMTQEYGESNKTIGEVVESEQQGEQRDRSIGQTFLSNYFPSFSRYIYHQPIEQELQVPTTLQNVKSNSSQNDYFEPLEPEPSQ